MWHYATDNTPRGPVDETTIRKELSNGTITAATMVWRAGMPDWLPLGQSELAHCLLLTAPQPPTLRVPPQAATDNPYNPPQTDTRPASLAPPGPMPMSKVLWSFEGRIPRRTYWLAVLIRLLVLVLLMALAALFDNEAAPGIVLMILIIPLIWTSLAVQVKRWHDRGKPGAMVLINLIPYIGGIWCFIECGCLRGTPGDNTYGQDPT